MKSRVLKGLGKVLLQDNTVADGGGLSALLVPKKVTPVGLAAAMGLTAVAGVADGGVKGHNRAELGVISASTPARMTGSFGSGAVQAMQRASKGNYAVFSDMAEEGLKGDGFMGGLETYGATPELISALYGMGRG